LSEDDIVGEVGEAEGGGSVFLVEKAAEMLDHQVEARKEALAEVGGDVASVTGSGRVDESGEGGVGQGKLEGRFCR
jgi:hypothetical protein